MPLCNLFGSFSGFVLDGRQLIGRLNRTNCSKIFAQRCKAVFAKGFFVWITNNFFGMLDAWRGNLRQSERKSAVKTIARLALLWYTDKTV